MSGERGEYGEGVERGDEGESDSERETERETERVRQRESERQTERLCVGWGNYVETSILIFAFWVSEHRT